MRRVPFRLSTDPEPAAKGPLEVVRSPQKGPRRSSCAKCRGETADAQLCGPEGRCGDCCMCEGWTMIDHQGDWR